MVTDYQISDNIHSFFQLDISQKSVSMIKHYVGGGFRYVQKRKEYNDEIGLAIAHIAVNPEAISQSNNIINETTVELNYKHFIFDKLQIQPYIHFIAMKEVGDQQTNPFVFALRAYFQF